MKIFDKDRFVALFTIQMIVISICLFFPQASVAENKESLENCCEIDNVPFVWQKYDGFSTFASVSSIFRCYGRDVDLPRALNVSGAGWGSIRFRDKLRWRFSAGPQSDHLIDIIYLADAYGMRPKLWYSSVKAVEAESETLSIYNHITRNFDIESQDLGGWEGAKRALKLEIENGNPVLLFLSSNHLPHKQYSSPMWESGTESGQAVVAFGYYDNGIEIMDPSMGGWGNEHERPSENERTYKISYENLRKAWFDLACRGLVFVPENKVGDLERLIKNRATDKLLPVDDLVGIYTVREIPSALRSSYSFGYKSYEDLSSDLAPENFESMLKSWNERENIDKIPIILSSIRENLIEQLTLARISYRLSLDDLENFVGHESKEIRNFRQAMNEFQNVSDNYYLVYPFGDRRTENTFLDKAFLNVINDLKSGSSISSAVSDAEPYFRVLSEEFEEIGLYLKNTHDALQTEKHPPIADTGGPYQVVEGGRIGLDGHLSESPGGKIKRYHWSIIEDPTENASIKKTDTADPVFVAPRVDRDLEVIVELTVVDEEGLTSSDNQVIKIKDSPEIDDDDDFSVIGIILGLTGFLSLLILIFWFRSKKT